MEEGIIDPGQQRRQALAGRQRRRVIPDTDVDYRRCPRQLGPGLRVQRAGGGQQLLHPGPALAHEVPQDPERPQHPEQVRQRRGIVGQVPAHRGGQVARLGIQPLQLLTLVGAAQRPVGALS